MPKRLKTALYIFLVGLLTLYAALFLPHPKRDYRPTEVLGATTNLTLYVQPDDADKLITDTISKAQKEILIESYLLSSPEIISALKDAKTRGVTVKVILEQTPFAAFSLNKKTKPELETASITVQWGHPRFVFTHEKSFSVDQKVVCILTANLTTAAFLKNREYNICSTNQRDISEFVAIFTADWERSSYLATSPNLVVSPDNSRDKLTAFIKSARASLDLEMEVLEDQTILDLLKQKSQTIPVRVLLPKLEKIAVNKSALAALKNSSVAVMILPAPYLHAKLIIVDKVRAYVGSINLTANSLDRNRELGLLISQPNILERLNQTFHLDWQNSQPATE